MLILIHARGIKEEGMAKEFVNKPLQSAWKKSRLGRLFGSKVRIPKAPDTCILGLHISKTGGTSILYNFRTHLDRGAFLNYGETSNVARFLSGNQLLENMQPSELLKYQFVFGHGVHEGLLETLPHADVALFCVFRDPYIRLLSQLKHQTRMNARKGVTLSPETFLQRRQNNPASHQLVKHFPTLAGQGDLRTQAHNVLKHFRFVFSTDNLTEQSSGLFRLVGAPPIKTKRRVYTESVELPGLSREDVYLDNQVDYEINEAINAMTQDPLHAESWNPFGYDPDALSKAREKMHEAGLVTDRREKFLTMFASNLHRKNSVLAAQEYACRSEMTGDIASMLETLSPKPKALSLEQSNLAKILHRVGESKGAIMALKKAIDLDNNNASAFYQLSVIYFSLQKNTFFGLRNIKDDTNLAKSLTLAEEASKRAPNWGDVEAHLGEILLVRKDREAAITHFKRAMELAPDNDGLNKKYKKITRSSGEPAPNL